jgi:hypothetical protein
MIRIRTCVFIISLTAGLMGFSRAQDAPDGKSIVTAKPAPKYHPATCAPPVVFCVPAPLIGPPPMLPPPLPEVYCGKKLAWTNQVRVPDEVHAYAIGRLPNGEGGMDEAHLYYRIEQSAHWDLRLPSKKQAAALTTGPKAVFYPPTYQPPPKDQRVRDAMAAADQARLAAEQAQRNFESATEDIHKKLQEDNQLKDEIQELLKQNQQLRERLEGSHANSSPTASPSKSDVPADQLKAWESHLIRYSGPSVTGTPSDNH